MAHATSFSYHAGILCYTTNAGLRVLDFNDRVWGRATEKVLGNDVFVEHFIGVAKAQGKADGLDRESLRGVKIQGYADDILTLVGDFGMHGDHLFAVNISETFNQPLTTWRSRMVLCVELRSTNRLFVRHNSRYLVVGTHSATGDDDHHEWLLQRYDLVSGKPVTKEPLQLRNFFGSDIGSTVCFGLYGDRFYAVTNQTSIETEEVDWTSYYQVIDFDVSDPHPDCTVWGIWRRQHLEGPINDAWTDLEFQTDHRTGELLIVECRKEWVDGGSRSIRTYYTQSFERAKRVDLRLARRHPPGDQMARTLDEKSNSRYEEPNTRVSRYVHAEFPAEQDGDGGSSGGMAVKEYIRAKTKWNGYHFNAQCFVDLVTEEVMVDGEWRPKERIKLRVVSRDELSPLVPDTEDAGPGSRQCTAGVQSDRMLVRPRVKDRDGEEMQDGEEAYSKSRVYLWPPDDMVQQEVWDILCPGGRAGDVKASLGDEGIVYMAGPMTGGERALVFVSFDPTFGFEGMRRLDGSVALAKSVNNKIPALSNTTGKMRGVKRGSGYVVDGEEMADRMKRVKVNTDCDQAGLRGMTGASGQRSLASPTGDFNSSPGAMGTATALSGGRRVSTMALPSPSPTLTMTGASPSSSMRDEHFPTVSPSRLSGVGDTGRISNPVLNGKRLTQWREKAMYLSINQGFWLR
ncbi:hypothetical protein LTR10_018057 [Elasticomyces elasticus]|uniref:Uncharacterized protein n=1 Tax=Exophiala sideris TaxID=1016849 RepID=A0ABR0JPK7_9EURO|nr:hypothetical protein LTR10_018057 [Elasticomyces elasticus]KAK5039539.1 hypothetical protein LTS07_000033 [Exophiala sideris]KAK5041092.1 hypothetical protein LTR13_002566 [Exophiala sideris]KAK5067916.1 hypothetical protein LTR69_000033 [Exophiala sideris]KAK5187218.1 hypothetical protein LTR44_000033 [Eurotiomycetes sp. CCFEE 6388]